MKEFFGPCNGWNHAYSSVVVIGSSVDEVICKSAEYCKENYETPEYTCYNGTEENGIITFDIHRFDPHDICTNLGKKLPNAVIYASMAWDYHGVCAMKNGKNYDDFTARFINDTPQMSPNNPDDGWDVDVKITDNHTGYSFVTGGGMCNEEDCKEFIELVDTH
jgi:hypothetical protein